MKINNKIVNRDMEIIINQKIIDKTINKIIDKITDKIVDKILNKIVIIKIEISLKITINNLEINHNNLKEKGKQNIFQSKNMKDLNIIISEHKTNL